ncbi:hypothetical protein MSG28_008718 [Choristoneura fumiferana]|uniref:Uncharacterized protein n=1 Tax=Choristoneura fumiferana TaxID=7141 RepID=A0ACC0J7S0_CHOFU|nr:hypothetical protein MSG28_008718 [Choristoneura fumiferana]
MAEKLKKKPSFFSLKSFKGHKDVNVSPRTPTTPNGQETQFFRSHMSSKYSPNLPILECPICGTKIQVTGPNFLQNLPSNLYIDSLLQLVGISNDKPKTSTPPMTPATSFGQSVDLFAAGVRCTQCQTMCDSVDVTACEHCKMNTNAIISAVSWAQHLDDMRTQVESILKQLQSAAERLEHKVEHYKDRCERITEQITITADEKINAIIESKEKLLKEASDLQRSGTCRL